MTESESKSLSILENRVRQLINLYKNLKNQTENLQISYERLEQENKILQDKYNNLKMVRIISVKQDDFKGAKNKLHQLLKEVDKCIRLLNE